MVRTLLVSVWFFGLIAGVTIAFDQRAIGNALAIVSCKAQGACTGGDNAGSGPGVAGTNNTLAGSGVKGASAAGIGVYGKTTSGAGLRGEGTKTGYGAYVTSRAGIGLAAYSTTGRAVYASAAGGAPAIEAVGGKGDGIDVSSNGGTAAAVVHNGAGTGIDSSGSQVGVVGRAPTAGFPLVATDSSGNNVFYVSGTGDVYYHGSLHQFVKTPDGRLATVFGTQSTTPVVQATGSATLANGVAYVALDRDFAASIDRRTPYRVLITPNGDTRGVYVARKDPAGFSVREVQGGRGSFAFDYQVTATPRVVPRLQQPPAKPTF